MIPDFVVVVFQKKHTHQKSSVVESLTGSVSDVALSRILLMTYAYSICSFLLRTAKAFFEGSTVRRSTSGRGGTWRERAITYFICHLWRDVSKTLERGTRKDWTGKEKRGKRDGIRKTED